VSLFRIVQSGITTLAPAGANAGPQGWVLAINGSAGWVGSLTLKTLTTPPGASPNYQSVAYQVADTGVEVVAGTAITSDTLVIVSPTAGDLVADFVHTSGAVNVRVTPATQGVTNRELLNAFTAAGYSTAGQNTTEAMLSVAVADMLGTTLNVKAFGAKGDGVTDDTAAIQAALDAAADLSTSVGVIGSVFFPPGRYLSTGVTHAGASVRLYGDAATIVQTANAPTLTLRGTWTIVNVSAVVASTYAIDGINTVACSKITVASLPSGLGVGSVVRIVADDATPGCRPAVGATVARVGEYGVVGAIVGLDIYLTGLLLDTYTTSPRLGLWNNATFEIEGLSFDTAPEGDALGWTEPLVMVRVANNCRFTNLRAIRGYGTFLQLVGLKDYVASKITVDHLTDDLGAERYGYGISDTSCLGGRIVDCSFNRCRHGQATACDAITAANANLEYYGRSIGGRVDSCVGIGGTNAPFDTHLGAYDWQFTNCRAQQPAFTAFVMRGQKIRLVNCVADRAPGYAFHFFDEGAAGALTTDGVLENCSAFGGSGSAIVAESTGGQLVVSNGEFQTSASDVISIDSTATVILSGGTRLVSTSANSAARIFDFAAAGVIEVAGDVVLDMVGMTGTATSLYVALFRAANATMRGSGTMTVLRSPSAAIGDGFNGNSAGRGIVQLSSVVFDTAPAFFIFGSSLQSGFVFGPYTGTGTPSGVVKANIGSTFLRADGGRSTTFVAKTSGTGNTGWANLWTGEVSADRGNTDQTLTVGVDEPIQRWASALGSNRTVTLSTTGAINGDRFRIVRTGLGAFTLDVGGLKTIPSATAAFVDVSYNGSAWVLTGYGLL
jgi:hypothetical protein